MPSTSKFFCPKCLRTSKTLEKCPICKIPTINIGKRRRLPKHNASKNKWKKELAKISWRIDNDELKKTYKKYNIDYKVFTIKKTKNGFEYYKIIYKPNGSKIIERI